MPKYRYYRKGIMDAVKGVKQAIDDTPTNSISTTTLAHEAGITRNTLQEVFKYRYGMSVGRYRLRLRMSLAKYLLSSGKTIKEAAVVLEYSSINAFTNAFRKYYGQTPSGWKTRGK